MKKPSSTAKFEKALAKQPRSSSYVLRLYVAGTSPRSIRAIHNARTVCDDKLKGRYELEVIDVFQQPALAKNEQIVAVPTLIRKLPLPIRRFIGDLSDRDGLLIGLDLKRK
ncbi:MAG TPA: circadian clock KaiB family protein [Polyangia bacterium]